MSRQKSPKGKKPVKTYDYGWFKPLGAVVFSRELQQSDAWADLEHAERGILMDLLWTASCAKGKPFFFTWSQCKTPVSETTFRKAVNRFCRMGLLKKRLDLKELKTGPDPYTSSGEWRKYKAGAGLLNRRKAQKKRVAASRSRLRKLKSNHS